MLKFKKGVAVALITALCAGVCGFGSKFVQAAGVTYQGSNNYVNFDAGLGSGLTFNVKGYFDGKLIKTTYSDNGYHTIIEAEGLNRTDVRKIGNDEVRSYLADGKELLFHQHISVDGKMVRVDYVLQNVSTEDIENVKIGSWADTQIGNNDRAEISYNEEYGLSMIDDNTSSGTYGAKFSLLCMGNATPTPVDTLYHAHYGSVGNKIFDGTIKTESTKNTDSGIAYSWNVGTIAPEQTVTKTVYYRVDTAVELDNENITFGNLNAQKQLPITVEAAQDIAVYYGVYDNEGGKPEYISLGTASSEKNEHNLYDITGIYDIPDSWEEGSTHYINFYAQNTTNNMKSATLTYAILYTSEGMTFAQERSVYYAGGNSASGSTKKVKAYQGMEYELEENWFRKSGYEFAGWSDGEKIYAPGEKYVMGDEDVTFTAQWAGTPMELSYDINTTDGVSGKLPETSMIKAGSITKIEFPELEREGYDFIGWSENQNSVWAAYSKDGISEMEMPDKACKLYAVWKIQKYAAVDSELNNIASSNLGEKQYAYHEEYKTTLSVGEHYALPEQIAIKCGDVKLADDQFTYDKETGEVTILQGVVYKDIAIIAAGVPDKYDAPDDRLVHITSSNTGKEAVLYHEDYKTTLAAEEGYELPNKIQVKTIKGQDEATEEIEVPADKITYDVKTGEVEIKGDAVENNIIICASANIKKYNVDIKGLKNITCSNYGSRKVSYGKEYTGVLTAKDGYTLPVKLVIKVNNKVLSEKQFSYNASTGKVSIKADAVKGNIAIEAVAKSKVPADKNLTKVDKDITKRKTNSDMKGSTFADLSLKAAGANKSVKLSWKKVKGATGYVIYGNVAGKKTAFRKVSDTSRNRYTVKGLKTGKYYKYMVVAYKKVGDQKEVLSISKNAFAVTKNAKKGNTTKIKLASKSKVTIKKGKSSNIKAALVKNKKKVTKYRGLAYESSNTKVATVTKKGKITGKKAGKATIYIYAQNGVRKTVTVTVK